MSKAVLLISHGSRSPKTEKEVRALVRALKAKSQIDIFEYAFLEMEKPSIPEGLKRCVQKGAGVIVVLLNFLNSGRHVERDIPRLLKAARRRYPKVKFRITKPIGQHKRIEELFLEMIK